MGIFTSAFAYTTLSCFRFCVAFLLYIDILIKGFAFASFLCCSTRRRWRPTSRV